MPNLDAIDILNPALYCSVGYPWRDWDVLRQEAPVFWYERPGIEPFWALTKYEDINWVSHNPQIFSSRQRMSCNTLEAVELIELDRERRAAAFGMNADDPPNLFWMDPPVHRQYRSIVSPCFTPAATARREAIFDALALQHVAEFSRILDERGEADVAKKLAARLPVMAICELVAAPERDWEQIFQWSEAMVGAGDPEYQLPGEDFETTFKRNALAFESYLVDLVKRRMEHAGDGEDVLSRLCRTTLNGAPLKFHEILFYVHVLLVAGNGTTRNSIANGVQALLQHPEELRKLADDPSLVKPAAEEILRWSSTLIQFARTCTEDTTLRGQRIRRGETVVMFYPSANRDEGVFQDPYRFDISRSPNPHFAFGGYGEHFCLGASLARAELRAALRALIPVLPKLELAGRADLVATHLQLGEIKSLPVRLRTASPGNRSITDGARLRSD